MDRLDAMATFLSVAERGSFSGASRALGMPLATVSRKVAELEAHLGTPLLIRTTRRLALTEAGTTYRAAARRILEEVKAAEEAAAGAFQTPRGELTVTAPILFGRLHILPVVIAFLAAYPEIDLRLMLSDRNLDLVEDHVDMAIRIGPLRDSSLVATRLGQMRRVVCASPALLAAYGVPETPADLARLPAITFINFGPVSAWRFRAKEGGAAIEAPLRPRLSVSTAEAAVAAAVAGVGVARVLHYQCAEAVAAGRLRLVLEAFEPEPLPVSALHAARRDLPLKARVFLDFVVERLASDSRHSIF